MKPFTVIHLLLFILFLLVYQCASAQDYLLTTRGDSIAGDTKPLMYSVEQKLQVNTGTEKKIFSIFEVRAFSHKGEIFHPVKIDNRYVFMKLLRDGYLSLYAFQDENQSRFDGLFFRKRDGQGIVVPNLGFKKYASKFLEDCPQVSSRIQEGELGKQDLTEIVSAYNACVDKRTIDHGEVLVHQQEQEVRISAWDELENSMRTKDFEEKENALEMVTDIKEKLRRGEKIPNFLQEALRNSLRNTGLSDQLEQALGELRGQ